MTAVTLDSIGQHQVATHHLCCFPGGLFSPSEFEGFLSDSSSFPQWAHLWLMTEHCRTNGEGMWFLGDGVVSGSARKPLMPSSSLT